MGREKQQCKELDWSLMGHFLVRFTYNGADYFGLSAQTPNSSATYFESTKTKRPRLKEQIAEPILPTVESAFEKALQKCNLIKTLIDSKCSRCGRTDRGVHARANYLTLQLRLTKDGKPYDYTSIMNGCLPPSIRVIWVKPCPVWLDARFHCLYRMYKYYFPLYFKDSGEWSKLNVDAMDFAAQQFIGSHDFRNFCKYDNSSNKTTQRQLYVCRISEATPTVGVALVTGPAFLWHQVRCMVGCLIQIGKGTLPPNFITKTLDRVLTPEKPAYSMAPPEGLVLWDCAFEDYNVVPPRCEEQGNYQKPAADASNLFHKSLSATTATFHEHLIDLEVQREVLKCLCTADDETRPFSFEH